MADKVSLIAIALGGAQMAMVASKDPEARQRENEPLMLRQALDDAIAEEAKRYHHT